LAFYTKYLGLIGSMRLTQSERVGKTCNAAIILSMDVKLL